MQRECAMILSCGDRYIHYLGRIPPGHSGRKTWNRLFILVCTQVLELFWLSEIFIGCYVAELVGEEPT